MVTDEIGENYYHRLELKEKKERVDLYKSQQQVLLIKKYLDELNKKYNKEENRLGDLKDVVNKTLSKENKENSGARELLFKQYEKVKIQNNQYKKITNEKKQEIQEIVKKVKVTEAKIKKTDKLISSAKLLENERNFSSIQSELNTLGSIKRNGESEEASLILDSANEDIATKNKVSKNQKTLEVTNENTNQKNSSEIPRLNIDLSSNDLSKNNNQNQTINISSNSQRNEEQEKPDNKNQQHEKKEVSSWRDSFEQGIKFSYEAENGTNYNLKLLANAEKQLEVEIDTSSLKDLTTLKRDKNKILSLFKKAGYQDTSFILKTS